MTAPQGYNTVSTYLAAPEADEVMTFAELTFDAAIIRGPIRAPTGRLVHAVLSLGDSTVLLAAPKDGQMRLNAMLHVYVDDCDATFARAVGAGGKVMMEPSDQFYGDRTAAVWDAAGNTWWIAERRHDVPDAEVGRLADEQRVG